MFRKLGYCFVVMGLAAPLVAQTPAQDAATPTSTLQINSRAVLVDVIVTDKSGKPVTGLKQDAFAVTEQGKPQSIGYFEEHTGAPATAPQELPKFPPDVFSNFSPFPQPAAVNVLLLDSLNTRMESQAVVHQQAMKFLKDLKPGSRMAIFTMGKGLHFIQGFTDDPASLFAALGNKKDNEVQSSDMLKGQEESNAQANLVGMMNAPVGNGGHGCFPRNDRGPATFYSGKRHFAGNRSRPSHHGESAAAGHVSQWFPRTQECDLVLRIADGRRACGSADGPGVAEDPEHAGRRAGCPLSGGCAGSCDCRLFPGG